VSHAGLAGAAIDNVQRYGGVIPTSEEIVRHVLELQEVAS
jgi:hypothetical protein